MSPRPRTVSDEEILAATARVISRVGPAQLTIAAVAAEAGFAPSSLMQRFGSKRALLLAFAQQGPQGVAAIFDEARGRRATPLDALEAALFALHEPVRTPEEMAHHLAFLQMDLTDPDFRRHAAAHGRTFRREAERLFREAIDAGQVGGGDPHAMASALQVVFNGALVTWAIHREGSLRQLVRRVLPIVLGVDAQRRAAGPEAAAAAMAPRVRRGKTRRR